MPRSLHISSFPRGWTAVSHPSNKSRKEVPALSKCNVKVIEDEFFVLLFPSPACIHTQVISSDAKSSVSSPCLVLMGSTKATRPIIDGPHPPWHQMASYPSPWWFTHKLPWADQRWWRGDTLTRLITCRLFSCNAQPPFFVGCRMHREVLSWGLEIEGITPIV